MNIVGSNSFLKNLRNLEYFKLDLGKTRRNTKTGKFNKLSDFEMKYKGLFNNPLIKYGNIGKATFYEDVYIKENKYYIFNDNNEAFEIHYTQDELIDFGDYILTSMRRIVESENEENEELENIGDDIEAKIKESDNTWTSNDTKNGKKEYLVDQRLSKEEYRKQLMEKKKKLS